MGFRALRSAYRRDGVPTTSVRTSGVGANGDRLYGYVVSLLRLDGADGATTFTDDRGVAWARNSTPAIDTAQSRFGGSSLEFNGSGQQLYTPYSSSFDFGSGDFCLEGWMRRSTTAAHAMFNKRTSGANGWAFGCYDDGRLAFRGKINGAWSDLWAVSAVGAVTVGNWHHVAVARDGSTLRTFIDGAVGGSSAVSGALNDQSVPLRIGTADQSAEWQMYGHLDMLRVTKGHPRYTGAFTVPQAAFPIET